MAAHPRIANVGYADYGGGQVSFFLLHAFVCVVLLFVIVAVARAKEFGGGDIPTNRIVLGFLVFFLICLNGAFLYEVGRE